MNILIGGTKSFSDYAIFMRAMGVVLSEPGDLAIYAVGPANINSYVREFFGVTEASLKARNKHVYVRYVPFDSKGIEKAFYFRSPGEHLPAKWKDMSDAGVDVLVFEF